MRAGRGNKINRYNLRGYVLLSIAVVKQAVRDAEQNPELYKDEAVRFLRSGSYIIQLAGLNETVCGSLIREINEYKKKTRAEKKAERDECYSRLGRRFGIYPEDFDTRQRYVQAIYQKKRSLTAKKKSAVGR